MKKAFTLIELLVVVLIIGILAAVAVPQYQKAVEKSRATQAIIAAKAIKDAEEVYYLANGKYTDLMEELDIDIAPLKDYGIDLNGSTYRRIRIIRQNSSTYEYEIIFGFDKRSGSPGVAYCVASKTKVLSDTLCKSFGGKLIPPLDDAKNRWSLN